MFRTFLYPLYPTTAQEAEFERILYGCQQLYNACLEQRIEEYRKRGKSPSRYDQQKDLTNLRKEDAFFGSIGVGVLRSAVSRLDKAYQTFFRRVKKGETPGFPRFKGKGRYDSFDWPEPVIRGNQVLVPRLGKIRFNLYRPLKGVPKAAVVERKTGKWFLSVQCDLGPAPTKLAVVDEAKTTGIDLGLTTFATLSNGEEIGNPRFLRTSEKKLAERQRKLSRKQRGSKSRQRAKLLVAKMYEHISNSRLDFARKTAKNLFSRFDLVGFEELNIQKMTRESRLSKSINDVAWGVFTRCLTCKAEEAGKWAAGVNPSGTSQDCSRCGEKVPKDLSQRTHDCPKCGLVLGRDLNAARNVHQRALGLSAVNSGSQVRTYGNPAEV